MASGVIADSQVPFRYDSDMIDALKASLSAPRFAGYVSKAGGYSSVAFELYVYNAGLAQAFLIPLNVTEVTFRNTVDGVLVKEFGPDWCGQQLRQHCPNFKESFDT